MFTEQPKDIATTQPKFQAASPQWHTTGTQHSQPHKGRFFQWCPYKNHFYPSPVPVIVSNSSMKRQRAQEKTYNLKVQIYSASLSNPLQMQFSCSLLNPPVWNTVSSHTMKDGKQINTELRKQKASLIKRSSFWGTFIVFLYFTLFFFHHTISQRGWGAEYLLK